MRELVLPGEGEPVGEGGQELAELEGAQVPFEVGADRVGQGHRVSFHRWSVVMVMAARCRGPGGSARVVPGAVAVIAAAPGGGWCRCRLQPRAGAR